MCFSPIVAHPYLARLAVRTGYAVAIIDEF